MSDDIVKPYYFREVKLWYYGESEPFGIYDRETKTITITNKQTMGEATIPLIQQDLEIAEASGKIGYAVTYGVSRKVWELRERAKYTAHEDL